MNGYRVQPMLRRSLNYKHFCHLDDVAQAQVLARMEVLIREEKEFCDRGNYQHLCDILSTIAMFETLCSQGMSKDQAIEAVGNEIYKALEPRRLTMERLAKHRWFWWLMRTILPTAFRLGSGTGWRFTWFPRQPKREFKFEVNECIYQKIFAKHNVKCLGPMICHSDIVLYGTLPHIDFQRKGTLCYEDAICDFKFVRYSPDEEFTRSSSR